MGDALEEVLHRHREIWHIRFIEGVCASLGIGFILGYVVAMMMLS